MSLTSVVSLPVAIVFWAAGMLLSSLQLGGFGLVAGLHPLWYGGIVVAVAGMLMAIATRRHTILLTSYTVAIAAMITATAMLLERSPRFPYIFGSYHSGEQILRTGVIDYSEVYVSWPGWHLVTAIAVGASGMDPSALLTGFPLWLTFVTVAALMTILRRFRLPRYQRWIAVLLAVTVFLGPVYPIPQTAAFVLLLYVLAILIEEHLGTTASIRGRAGMVLLLAALVPMHLLTSVVGVAIVLGVSILTVLVFHRRAGPTAVLGVVLVSVYLAYVAIEVTARLLPQQIETVLNIDRLFGSVFSSTASAISRGSDEHLQVVRVRIGYVVGLAVLGALGALVAVLGRAPVRRWILPTAWAAGGIASIGVGGYGGEILARGSALAAPGTLALASWLARVRTGRVLLAAAVLAGGILSPVNHFGNELFDYVRPTELATDEVLATRHPTPWNLHVPSRTWYRESGDAASGPFVTVYGPLYVESRAQIAKPEPPVMPYWSYDNGDLRIMVAWDVIP